MDEQNTAKPGTNPEAGPEPGRSKEKAPPLRPYSRPKSNKKLIVALACIAVADRRRVFVAVSGQL